MPTPKEVNQQQQIQSAQQGVVPMDFDPEMIMQEIAAKDMQNQAKEQELIQREDAIVKAEEQVQKMNEQIQAEQVGAAQSMQEQANEPVVIPVVPPPQQQQKQQQNNDVNPQTIDSLQPGQSVTVTKKIDMTPEGPIETSRSENVTTKKGKENATS